MTVHIVSGSTALLAGGAALALPKGGALHAKVGIAFVVAMAIMGVAGSALAIAKPDRITATMGMFSLYLVLTSWSAARGDGAVGRFERYAFVAGCGLTATYLALGIAASRMPHGRIDHLPGAVAFVFGAIAALASAFDLSAIRRGRLAYRQRVARHLWRMCVALFIAAMSFFIGQQKVMPAGIRGAPWLYLPPFAVLGAMLFWAVRTRFAKSPWTTSRQPGPGTRAAAHPRTTDRSHA